MEKSDRLSTLSEGERNDQGVRKSPDKKSQNLTEDPFSSLTAEDIDALLEGAEEEKEGDEVPPKTQDDLDNLIDPAGIKTQKQIDEMLNNGEPPTMDDIDRWLEEGEEEKSGGSLWKKITSLFGNKLNR